MCVLQLYLRIMPNTQRDPSSPWKEASGEWRRKIIWRHAFSGRISPQKKQMKIVDKQKRLVPKWPSNSQEVGLWLDLRCLEYIYIYRMHTSDWFFGSWLVIVMINKLDDMKRRLIVFPRLVYLYTSLWSINPLSFLQNLPKFLQMWYQCYNSTCAFQQWKCLASCEPWFVAEVCVKLRQNTGYVLLVAAEVLETYFAV